MDAILTLLCMYVQHFHFVIEDVDTEGHVCACHYRSKISHGGFNYPSYALSVAEAKIWKGHLPGTKQEQDN